MDNIFILKYVVQKERWKDDKKVYAVFLDLKAAFDNIDREKLWDIQENKEIDRSLIIHLKKIYEGTRTAVWTKN